MRRHPASQLFILGFLGLFLELILIRYLPSRVWNLGYFPNFVLFSTFLGMGLGFTLHRRLGDRLSRILFDGCAVMLLALVLAGQFFRSTVPGLEGWSGLLGGDLYFTNTPLRNNLVNALRFILLLLSIVLLFTGLTQRTAKLFKELPPLRAYTLDIAGSCCGILSFILLSFLQAPAWLWFTLLLPPFLYARDPGGRGRPWLPVSALALCCLVVAWQDAERPASLGPQGLAVHRWSPYQKVQYWQKAQGDNILLVNGISHQAIVLPGEMADSFYQVPHVMRRARGPEPFRKVLVLGAGTGNDVAAALANGAERVDAVEIDPAIAAVGRDHNPSGPYGDPRVRLIVDDGRAFMTRAREGYDLVIFALTDSLVKASSLSQLRLENYLFTEQSFRRAFQLLDPDGVLVIYNSYRKPWLVQRFHSLLSHATGLDPKIIYQKEDFYVLALGRGISNAAPLQEGSIRPDLPTDDWPFPYLEKKKVPGFYLGAISFITLLLAVLALALKRKGPSGRGVRPALPIAFFLMGAAFLLLESKSVVQFSLLFGTTWLNNSLVFLAILLSVLAANRIARKFPGLRPSWFLGLALVSSCLLSLLFPLHLFLGVESPLLRLLLAALVGFSPIFFANLLFSAAFRDQGEAERLFGWNLLGSASGGVAEYASMALGYNALALVVALLYAAVAWLLLSRAVPKAGRSRRPLFF